MPRFPTLLVSLAPLIAAPNVNAAIAWPGTWSGTLGEQTIVVCNDGKNGSYHGSGQAGLTVLHAAEDHWLEDGDQGSWSIESHESGTVVGHREDGSGVRQPLRLTRLQPDAGAGCGSASYQDTLRFDPRVAEGKVQQFEDHRYRALSASPGAYGAIRVESVELLDDDPFIAELNRQLRAALPNTPGDWLPYEQCARRGPALGRSDAAYLEQTTPRFWTARWLSLQTGLTQRCGDKAPQQMWGYRSWDLKSGKEIDLWSWFGTNEAFPEQRHRRGIARLPSALQAVVLKDWPVDEECRAAVNARGLYALRPAVLGLVFERVDVPEDCSDEVEIPYRKLMPLLTPAGRLAIRSLLESAYP